MYQKRSRTCRNRSCPKISSVLNASPMRPAYWPLIQSLADWRTVVQSLPGNTVWAWLVAFILIFGAEAWWIWLIARRRKNWARWFGVVVLVLALPGYIYFLAAKFQDAPLLAYACLLDAILWYVSFYLWGRCSWCLTAAAGGLPSLQSSINFAIEASLIPECAVQGVQMQLDIP